MWELQVPTTLAASRLVKPQSEILSHWEVGYQTLLAPLGVLCGHKHGLEEQWCLF